tara:strand:- start:526 stop:693 length:168 start_codon:yes stop_codon:yes gene_type:complete
MPEDKKKKTIATIKRDTIKVSQRGDTTVTQYPKRMNGKTSSQLTKKVVNVKVPKK